MCCVGKKHSAVISNNSGSRWVSTDTAQVKAIQDGDIPAEN